MRADQFDATLCQAGADPLRIGSSVVKSSLRVMLRHVRFDQRLDAVNLSMIGRCGKGCQRDIFAIDHQHDFGPLAFLGVADGGVALPKVGKLGVYHAHRIWVGMPRDGWMGSIC